MIRRDYFLRAVQEMTQALVRVLFLKQREEYTQATFKLIRWLRVHWHRPTSLAQALLHLHRLYARL